MLRQAARSLLMPLALGVGAVTRPGTVAPCWEEALRASPGRPLVIAHRGSSALAPENSLAAFRLAMVQGADAIELDVRRCRSGELVVVHDAGLERTAGVARRVADCSLEELRGIEVAPGEPVPTLEAVLTDPLCPQRVNIEIKADSTTSDGIEAALVALLDRLSARDRVVISSFNPFVLARLSWLDPGLSRGFLFHPETKFRWLRGPYVAPIVRPHLLHPWHALIHPGLMRQARLLRYRVMAWTVDEPAEWTRLTRLGVDGIITNRPLELREHLQGLVVGR